MKDVLALYGRRVVVSGSELAVSQPADNFYFRRYALRTILQVFDDPVTRASSRFKTLPVQNSDIATAVID